MPECKAREIVRKEAYLAVRRKSVKSQTGVFQQPAKFHIASHLFQEEHHVHLK